MQIGELARAAGVNTKTVRFYEEVGVLPPADRAPNGYRIYTPEAVERLAFVKEAQATGLTLEEITSVLELREQGASTCQHVLGLLERHLRELDVRIDVLRKTRRELAAMIERGRRLDPAECADPNRCQTIASPHSMRQETGAELHGAPTAHRH
jgi:DNA-binding transcriptional MerR regulator